MKKIFFLIISLLTNIALAENINNITPIDPATQSSIAKPIPPAIKMSPSIIAIVDTQYIFSESKAAKTLKEQIEKKRAEYQAQLSTKQKELDKKKTEIEALQGKTSQAEYDKKAQIFSEEVAKVNKDVNEKKMRLEQAAANSLLEIEKAIMSIIEKMAGEYGFNQVDNLHVRVYSKPEANISYEIVKRLDVEMPKVTLQIK